MAVDGAEFSSNGNGEKKSFNPPPEGIKQTVTPDQLKAANERIQKSNQIAQELKPTNGQPFSRERLNELRDIEMQAEQGDAGKRNGLEEIVIDTRGYEPHSFQLHRTDATGKSSTENLVYFTKKDQDGKTVYLEGPNGEPLAVNAALYGARLTSGKHPQGVEFSAKTMVRVDHRGSYTGIVTFFEDKNMPATLPPEVPETSVSAETDLSKAFDADRIKQELAKVVNLEDLPAADVLGKQLDKSHQDLLKKLPPNPSAQQIAFNLAARFFKAGLYKRIAEDMIGPQNYERHDNPDDLAADLPAIRAGLLNAENEIKNGRPQAKIIKDNGWFYVDQGKHKTDYRIYLSPDPHVVGKIFGELALTMPEQVRYQMKTFDRPDKPVEVARMDKIIIYCPDGDFAQILQTVEKVYKDNKASFDGRPAPGGGKVVPVEGVSIIEQPQAEAGKEKTGTEKIADLYDDKLDQKLPQLTREKLSGYPNAAEAAKSAEAKLMWSMLQAEGLTGVWYLGDGADKLKDNQINALEGVYKHIL